LLDDADLVGDLGGDARRGRGHAGGVLDGIDRMTTLDKQQELDAARYQRVFAALGQILANEFKGGESVLYLASRYSLEVEDVEECLRYVMRATNV
jgi:hypothetical protein